MIEPIVRREELGEVAAIAAVLAGAFRRPESPDADPPEVDLVARLRRDPAWIASLSLVAEVDGRIIGHILCTRATIDGYAVLALGPIGVLPEHQGRGVGTALMNAMLVAAGLHGEGVICLVGAPAFYTRFGFVPAHTVGISPPDPSWGDHFQALVAAGTETPLGVFAYAPPFGELD